MNTNHCGQDGIEELRNSIAERDEVIAMLWAEIVELRQQIDLVTGEMGVAHRHMEQVAVIDEVAELEAVMDAVADALGDAYDCIRVWEAWFVGTMSHDDFVRVADSGERLAEIASAAIGAMRKPSEQTAAAIEQDVAPYREDAERYRWLKAQNETDDGFCVCDGTLEIIGTHPGSLDVAIDAARKVGV